MRNDAVSEVGAAASHPTSFKNPLLAELDRLERELADERELRDNMLVELEGKNRQLQTDLNMARSEFQKYKVKAAVALQQNSSTALEARISELEEAKGRLERERSQQRNELEAAVARSAAAEAELSASLDRIELLEGRIRSLENLGKDAGVARQEFETLRNTVELDKARANEALRARDAEWEAKLVSARKDMDARLQDAGQALRQKEDETGSLRAISEGLSSQLTAARDEITGLRKELDETKRSAAAWAVAAAGHQRNAGEEGLFSASSVQPSSPFAAAPPPYQYASGSSAAAGQSAKRGQQGSSLQDLLSRRDSIDSVTSSTQGPGMSSREKEFAAKLAHMAELLNESEAQVTRLMEQEALLKEEIRSMDRADKRANLNIEYLKNVLLQFLESPSERPQLVLVLTNILQLTRNEANRLKASVGDGDPVSAAANSIGSALGLW
ncbi:hypothetical protein DFJ74DRAFT_328710 [Hyaloraphidium curvatum]|nr:hypothetical protein DFJ74DRAFT_328710 [Hyaloraphidium curvatum]